MSTTKVAITIDENMLSRLDCLVRKHLFPNRSRLIQEAVREKLERIDKNRLARESAKLNPKYEQAMADEGLATEIREWPKY